VNDPAKPLVNAADTETFGDRLHHATVAIATSGSVVAGFHCAKTISCPGRRLGVLGRLTQRGWHRHWRGERQPLG
jgi:hypothetical protein